MPVALCEGHVACCSCFISRSFPVVFSWHYILTSSKTSLTISAASSFWQTVFMWRTSLQAVTEVFQSSNTICLWTCPGSLSVSVLWVRTLPGQVEERMTTTGSGLKFHKSINSIYFGRNMKSVCISSRISLSGFRASCLKIHARFLWLTVSSLGSYLSPYGGSADILRDNECLQHYPQLFRFIFLSNPTKAAGCASQLLCQGDGFLNVNPHPPPPAPQADLVIMRWTHLSVSPHFCAISPLHYSAGPSGKWTHFLLRNSGVFLFLCASEYAEVELIWLEVICDFRSQHPVPD